MSKFTIARALVDGKTENQFPGPSRSHDTAILENEAVAAIIISRAMCAQRDRCLYHSRERVTESRHREKHHRGESGTNKEKEGGKGSSSRRVLMLVRDSFVTL